MSLRAHLQGWDKTRSESPLGDPIVDLTICEPRFPGSKVRTLVQYGLRDLWVSPLWPPLSAIQPSRERFRFALH